MAKLCSDDRVSVLNEVLTNETLHETKKPRLEVNGDGTEILPGEVNQEEEQEQDDDIITLPLSFMRNEWPQVGDTPKQILLNHCKHNRIPNPTYSTVCFFAPLSGHWHL